MPEISAICERVIIINKGKIVAVDTPENLSKKLTNDNKFVIRIAGVKNEIEDTVSAISGIRYIESLGQKEEGSFDYIIESEKDVDVRSELFNILASKQMPILMVKAVDMSLEDIFLQITDSDISLTEEVEENEDVYDNENISEDINSDSEENSEIISDDEAKEGEE